MGARKLIDILRTLPPEQTVSISEAQKTTMHSRKANRTVDRCLVTAQAGPSAEACPSRTDGSSNRTDTSSNWTDASSSRTEYRRRVRGAIGRGCAALAALLLTAALLPMQTASATDGLAHLPALKPVMDCAAVTRLSLAGVTDAAVTITSASVMTTDAPAPYCAVQGTIAPANTFVMRLPINGWTQRYVQTGCGGMCGSATINYTQAATCPVVADGTVASATTDMGHQGLPDGSWAADNPQAQVDLAYRGVHVTRRSQRRSSRASTASGPRTRTSAAAPTAAARR